MRDNRKYERTRVLTLGYLIELIKEKKNHFLSFLFKEVKTKLNLIKEKKSFFCHFYLRK